MTQQTPTPLTMKALKMTYNEARQGRAAAEALAPLLALLDPAEPGEAGPLQEVTDLLQALVRTQQSILAAIEVLARKVDTLAAGRR